MAENSSEHSPPPQSNEQPANPSRRGLFAKVLAATVGIPLGMKAVSMAAQSETAQKFLKTAPGQTPPDRPSDYKMQTEIQQNLDAQSRQANPSLTKEEQAKAEETRHQYEKMWANPQSVRIESDQSPKASPTPLPENKPVK